jgi:hypothetical protein
MESDFVRVLVPMVGSLGVGETQRQSGFPDSVGSQLLTRTTRYVVDDEESIILDHERTKPNILGYNKENMATTSLKKYKNSIVDSTL